MKRLTTILSAIALAALPIAAQSQDAGGPVDPASLEAAELTVDYIFPNGTYARVMDKTMDAVIGNMMKGAMNIPMRDLAAMSGRSDEEIAKLGDGTLMQVMEILDPAYEPRMKAMTGVMMGEMGKVMTQFEPSIRDGLAHAYARRYTTAQLSELNRFFATPTGKAYAADSMIIFMSPEVMAKMQDFMPVMMKQMPALMAKVKDAAAGMPQPRRPDELSKEEREQLAELLGVPEDQLGKRGYGLEAVK